MKNIQGKELPILAVNLIYYFSRLTTHILRYHPEALDDLPVSILYAMYCSLWLNNETPSMLSTRLLHRIISEQS